MARKRLTTLVCFLASHLILSPAFSADQPKPAPPQRGRSVEISRVAQAIERTGDQYKGASIEPRDGVEPETIKERYPNRVIKIERVVVLDTDENYINHGPWKLFNPQGTLVAEGEFYKNERHGEWRRWYRRAEAKMFANPPYDQFSEPFLSVATFQNGKLHGTWTVYDAKQRKVSEWNYLRGRRHGKSTWWNNEGQTTQETDYVDGRIDGKLLSWVPGSSEPKVQIFQNGREVAAATEKYPNGHRKVQVTIIRAPLEAQNSADWWAAEPEFFLLKGNEEKHGAYLAWHANGQQSVRGAYEHDQRHGTFVWWHENGQKASQGTFKHGQPEGRFVWWHGNGQKQRAGEYYNGVPRGEWITWATDGAVVGREVHTPGSTVVKKPAVEKSEEPARIATPGQSARRLRE